MSFDLLSDAKVACLVKFAVKACESLYVLCVNLCVHQWAGAYMYNCCVLFYHCCPYHLCVFYIPALLLCIVCHCSAASYRAAVRAPYSAAATEICCHLCAIFLCAHTAAARTFVHSTTFLSLTHPTLIQHE